MTLDNRQNLKNQTPNLEKRFNALRVYGDERDFEVFEVKESKSEKNCEVPMN